jgi:hypothetical protein
MFGSANLAVVCVAAKKGDIYTIDKIKKVDGVTRAVLQINGANPYQVSSITHPSVKKLRVSAHGISMVPLIEKVPETPEELERVKNDIYTNEGIRGAYVSPDNKSALIFVGFWEETDMNKIYGRIDEIIKKYKDNDTEIYVTGFPMLYAWIYHYMPKIFLVFVISGLVLCLLLWLNFKSWRGIVIPTMSAGLSGLWAFGFAAAMGYNIDLLILVVPVLLMGRDLAHSVQCLERYYEEYQATGDKEEAVIATYSKLFTPATFSIITDGLGILTIAVASIPLMQKLAFMGGFWIISMWVSILTFQPLLQCLLPSHQAKSGEKQRKKSALQNVLNALGSVGIFCCRGRVPGLVVIVPFLVVVLGATYTVRHLVVGDTRPGATIFYPDHPFNVSYDFINERFWGTNELILIMAGEKKEALKNPLLLSKMQQLRLHMAEDPELGGSMTFLDLIHRLNRTFHEGLPVWEVTPSDPLLLSTLLFLLESNSSPGEMSRFFSVDYRNASLMFYYKRYSNSIITNALEKAKEFINKNVMEGGKFRLAGGAMGVAAAVNSEVEWSYWVNLITIFAAVVLICFVIYKSILVPLILILPLAFAQVVCDLLMLIFGVDLNINSLPVASIGVGVGINYGIYMLDRILFEYQELGNYEQAVIKAVSTTGHGVIFTAITMVASVIFWFLSGLKFHTEMANLIAVLLILNMFGAMTIVPAAVLVLKPFGKGGKSLTNEA